MSKVTKRPVYASDDVLGVRSFSRTSKQVNEDISHPAFLDSLTQPTGWKFTSYHDKILNEKGLGDLTRTIKVKLAERFPSLSENDVNVAEWIEEDSLNVNACKLHVPPMLFGNDIFRIQFGEFVLSVSANDALLCWAAQHTQEEVSTRPLDIIKVPYAAKWTARMHDSFGTGGGSGHSSGSGSGSGSHGAHSHSHGTGVTPTSAASTPLSTTTSASSDSANSVLTTDASSVVSSVRECDWTFSSDYVCSILRTNTTTINSSEDSEESTDGESSSASIDAIHSNVTGGAVLRALTLPAAESQAPLSTAFSTTHTTHTTTSSTTGVPASWVVHSEANSGIDFEMLKNQDEPILFYDEFILYQDDLEDCGEVTMEAKLRVMPQCWFLLVKHFLRVDGARVRCRETRFFHKFSDSAALSSGAVKIAMDVCWRELAATPVQQQSPVPSAAPPAPAPSGIMSGIAASSTHPGLAGRTPFAPPPQALHSTSNGARGGPLSAEAQLFGSQGKNLTHLVPVVNEKEGIHQHYSIRFTAKSEE